MLTFLSIADKLRPKWIVWENVPGVLSSNGGKDFGTFLGALGELGYGFAYRVLDAQHFGVAQRRRRVFVVGYLGDWRVAAAVLFERESLQGNTKPSRKKREEVASDAEASVGESGDVSCVGGNISPTVTSKWKTGYGGPSGSNETGNMVYAPTVIDRAAFNQGENAQYEPRIETGETMSSLVAKGPHAVAQPIPVLAGEHPQKGVSIDVCPTLPAAMGMGGGHTPLVPHPVAQPIAFKVRGGCEGGGKGYLGQEEQAFTISATQDQQIAQPMAIDWRTAQVDQGITQTLKTDLAKMSGPCIAVDTYNQTINEHTTQTIRSKSDTDSIGSGIVPKAAAFIVAKGAQSRTIGYREENAPTLVADSGNSHAVMQPMAFDWQSGGDMRGMNLQEKTQLQRCQTPAVMHSMAIRRLTPKECERLQGFPDDWTKIPYRNKEADQCPDGPRYKACGNSMAVPVMRWIGERINLIEAML
jgi:DNA (cytosine-5)-methyltransferase 1